MKKLRPYLPAVFLLVILLFSLWSGAYSAAQANRWREQIQQADTLAQAENWSGAENALKKSYQDWLSHQAFLHILCQHSALDDAEVLYHRGLAFIDAQEFPELHAELASLQDQFRVLSERQECSWDNIL